MRLVPTLLLLCLLSAPAFAGDADLLAAGRAATLRGENDQAVKLFEQAVAANPKNAEAHYLLGIGYGNQARNAGVLKMASMAKKAKAEFERAIAIDPNHLNARQALVDFYKIAPGVMGGSDEKALEQAAEIKKRDALAGRRAYARIHMHDKKPDLARKELVEAVREQPNNPRAHQAFGLFLLNTDKNYSSALHEFEMALKLDPNYGPAMLRIGQHAAITGTDFARGEQFIKKYFSYKPNDEEPPHAVAWYWLGMLYEKNNRKADAKNAFQQAAKLAPGDKNIKEALKRVS
jgi:tetratricopeptide (TPR) repeat protein